MADLVYIIGFWIVFGVPIALVVIIWNQITAPKPKKGIEKNTQFASTEVNTKPHADDLETKINPAKKQSRPKPERPKRIRRQLSQNDLMVQCYLANREEEFEIAVDQYEQSDLLEHHYECSDSFDELNIDDLKQYEDDMLKADETCPITDMDIIESLVLRKNINLYHFTDRSNIPLIKKAGGLFSWQELNHRKIFPLKPGGSEFSRQLDLRKNLGNYVRLCFHPDQPMKYVARRDGRIPDPVILRINIGVVYYESTLYSDVNATAGDANIGETYTHFSNIDFDLFNRGAWATESEKHRFQAEVLVQTYIPLRFIININEF